MYARTFISQRQSSLLPPSEFGEYYGKRRGGRKVCGRFDRRRLGKFHVFDDGNESAEGELVIQRLAFTQTIVKLQVGF